WGGGGRGTWPGRSGRDKQNHRHEKRGLKVGDAEPRDRVKCAGVPGLLLALQCVRRHPCHHWHFASALSKSGTCPSSMFGSRLRSDAIYTDLVERSPSLIL